MLVNERKFPVLALSACSIPVMLAFAGFSTRAAGLQSPALTSENIAIDLVRHQRSHEPVDSSVNAGLICTTDTTAELDNAKSEPLTPSDASWMCVAPDGDHFWVANGKGSSIATYRFAEATVGQANFELVSTLDVVRSSDSVADKAVVMSGGWVELQLSEDGQWLYQLFEHTGAMAVYEVDGNRLTFVELLTA